MPRKKIEIDFDEVERLCGLFCTAKEIANKFGISVDTLDRRLHEHYNCGFSEYFKKHNSEGKISLRANQLELSKKNATMAIWLGKQMLGQSDEGIGFDQVETVEFEYEEIE
jgi:hypothetical protein